MKNVKNEKWVAKLVLDILLWRVFVYPFTSTDPERYLSLAAQVHDGLSNAKYNILHFHELTPAPYVLLFLSILKVLAILSCVVLTCSVIFDLVSVVFSKE